MADQTSISTASEQLVATSTSVQKPRIDSLILDAGAIISQTPLATIAKSFFIPPSVIEEIKDLSARNYLSSLRLRSDFDLNIVQPSLASLVAVTKFAKKTGDYTVLSREDLEVLALTYEKEVERHGTWRIRTEVGGKAGQQLHELKKLQERQQNPELQSKQKQQNSSKEKNDEQVQRSEDGGEAIQSEQEQGQQQEDQTQLDSDVGDQTFVDSPEATEQVVQDAQDAQDAEQVDRELSVQFQNQMTIQEEKSEPQQPFKAASTTTQEPADGQVDSKSTSLLDDLEDDGEGEWITPENLQYHKNVSLGLITEETKPVGLDVVKKNNFQEQVPDQEEVEEGWEKVETATKSKPHNSVGAAKDRNPFALNSKPSGGKKAKQPSHLTVACITGDFAVQNVLLHMGLSLVGVGGQQITKIKSYVLRCHACTKICKDMERKFCPSCGNVTLLRTSVSMDGSKVGSDAKAALQVHLKTNFRYHNRGTQYSIPLPKPGSASGGKTAGSGLILREDQAEWQRALGRENVRKRKEERSRLRAIEKGKDSLSVRYQEEWDAGDLFLYGKMGSMDKGGLPSIGHGRKNPNERRRLRK